MPDICAYCKQPAVLTREHLWPASLHERLLKANAESLNIFWLARLQREIPSEPQIRDVCAHCNNVVLSDLDKYICTLFDAAFVHIPQRNERVAFEYDYHRLKRWLLKMSFNSARIHRCSDLFALEAVLPYIIGENYLFGESVQLFVQLSYPEEVPEADLSTDASSERPIIVEPTINRAGHVFFRVPGVGQKVLRAVHLQAIRLSYRFISRRSGAAAARHVRSRHIDIRVLGRIASCSCHTPRARFETDAATRTSRTSSRFGSTYGPTHRSIEQGRCAPRSM